MGDYFLLIKLSFIYQSLGAMYFKGFILISLLWLFNNL